MTPPGERDWPAACFPRPISHTMTFTTIQQVNMIVVMSLILPTIRSYEGHSVIFVPSL